MSTIETTHPSSCAHDGTVLGTVRAHRDWVPGSHFLTVRHLPTKRIFELVLPEPNTPGDRIAPEKVRARLVHVCIGAGWVSEQELAVLCAEAAWVRLHQHGLVTLVDEEGRRVPRDDYAGS